jgi:hypothetical protein
MGKAAERSGVLSVATLNISIINVIDTAAIRMQSARAIHGRVIFFSIRFQSTAWFVKYAQLAT